MGDNLFIQKIDINRSKINSYDEYPFNIKWIKNFKGISLNKWVTFLVGENGSGKSTFIEALAVSLKLNAEGRTQNFNFETKNTHSNLFEYLKVYKNGNIPKTKFFLKLKVFIIFLLKWSGYMKKIIMLLYIIIMEGICIIVLMENPLLI